MSDTSLPTRAEDMFCHAVYVASHAINQTYAPLLRAIGLTYPQYITMTMLWEDDGLRVGELAARLGMKTSTVTPLLKRLETMGHVTRERSAEDERQVIVSLTAAGRSLRSNAPGITACMIEATGLEIKQLDDLVATLEQLTRNLKAPEAGQ